MKRLFTAVVFSATASVALAQTTSAPTANDPTNNAVSTSSDNNAGHPLAGANSFTEDQARSRIEAKGYTKVSELSKDSSGVWRGKGMMGGSTHNVAVDYQGNVFSQ